jgi:hypothetical protein
MSGFRLPGGVHGTWAAAGRQLCRLNGMVSIHGMRRSPTPYGHARHAGGRRP